MDASPVTDGSSRRARTITLLLAVTSFGAAANLDSITTTPKIEGDLAERVDAIRRTSDDGPSPENVIRPSALPPVGRLRLRVSAAEGVNGGQPVAVEVVAALTEPAARRLARTDAAAWFSGVPHGPPPDEEVRSFVQRVVGPLECVDFEIPFPGEDGLEGLFLFAGFSTPGFHRLRPDWVSSPLLVELRADGMNASPGAEWTGGCPGPSPDLAASGPGDGAPREAARRHLVASGSVTVLPDDPGVCRSDFTSFLGGAVPDLADAATTLLENPDAERRAAAARAIGLLIGRGRDASDRPDPEPRTPKDHHHALIAGASDPDPSVRLAAICALGRVGDRRALEPLGWRTTDREPAEIRQAAEWALARILARTAAQT